MKMAEKFNKPIVTLLIHLVLILDWKLKNEGRGEAIAKIFKKCFT